MRVDRNRHVQSIFLFLPPFKKVYFHLPGGMMGGGGGRKGAEWPKTENSEISEPWFKWETMGTMGKIPYEWPPFDS